MGARSRRKGKVGELEVVSAIKPVFPKARRRVSGEESQLVDQGRDLDGTAPFVLQANFSHAPPIYRKLAEAASACGLGQIPVAVTKRTRGEWLATMRLDDWLTIVKPFMAQVARLVEQVKYPDLPALDPCQGCGRTIVLGDPARPGFCGPLCGAAP